ncbi:MAG: RagB/SusD family nutrient uptake outer membrane protein [Bacteroides sp.]
MKKAFKIFSLFAATALLWSSCIEETFPESGSATSEQVGSSSSALEAALNGIPSQMADGYYYVYGTQYDETDMAYPQYMIAQTELLGDMYPLGANTGYDWYRVYNTCERDFGETTVYAYLPWFTMYRFIKAANDVIGAVDFENAPDNLKGLASVAYACRAFDYYMLMVLFEPLENGYTDISNVKGLTVPIVTEATTAEEAKNNPRVSHDDMVAFILSDLDKAEEGLTNFTPSSKNFPDLSVVYGLKAKVYLWDEDYAKAAEYAAKAIETAKANKAVPMTKAQLTDVKTGFNTATPGWMWYVSYSAEGTGNLCNFIGWMSGEAYWGYGRLTSPSIDRSLYNKISETDYRKPQFLDPQKYGFYDYQTVRDEAYIESAPACLSLKFRCVNGDWENYKVGAICDVPVMRIEEMYLIEAEAVGASQGVAAGVEKLNSFMKSYRDPAYNYTGTDLREFQLEVLTQMRIEFWGEGNAFPSAKRLRPEIIQNYEGTNAPGNTFKVNFPQGKPNWNLCIPISEVQANSALEGKNNPNPAGRFVAPAEIGKYCEKK